MELAAIVPIKEYSKAKSRLAKILPLDVRIELSKAMLKDVILALNSNCEIKNIIVVTPNKNVDDVIALSKKVKILHDEGIGQVFALKKALNYTLKIYNPDAILIAVADLPSIRPQDISKMIYLIQTYHSIVLAPSTDGGTNVMIQYPPAIIDLKYGPMSFKKHVEEAYRKKVFFRIYFSETTSIDLDTLDDLRQVMRIHVSYNTREVIKKIKEAYTI